MEVKFPLLKQKEQKDAGELLSTISKLIETLDVENSNRE